MAGNPRCTSGRSQPGEVVLNSTASPHAHRIRHNYNDARAIEMEGAGVAQAAHLNKSLPVVVIRGVSDHADGSKETTDCEDWQARAVANAAAFATALAETLATEEPQQREPADTKGTPKMSEANRNVAKDNARVVVQAGHVHGGIRVSGEQKSPADPAAAINELALRLRRARTAHLDEDTYRAAEAKLAAARETLQTTDPQDVGAVTLALKKVRGLVGDVAALSAEVASVIALVQGLS